MSQNFIINSPRIDSRMHLIIPGVLRYLTVKRLPHAYRYLYASLTLYYELHLQWLTYKTILLSGYIESNPGPNLNTFKFYTWNLNIITAHEFIRISQIEAYNSIYNYDLIGVMETHLDSTFEDSKLMLNGYTFIKDNNSLDVKRGGVGLFKKDSFPATNRPDIAIIPECIVCEIQVNQKKYFFCNNL